MEPADVDKLVQEAIKLTAGQEHIQEELRLLQAKLRFGKRGKGPRTRWHNDRLVCHKITSIVKCICSYRL